MITASLTAQHIAVLCSDGFTRRFYHDASEAPYRTCMSGHVVYHDDKVNGSAIKGDDGLFRFVVKMTDTRIPTKVAWQPAPNCAALNYCKQCRRCVGGCRV
jgi:hypothetical protein